MSDEVMAAAKRLKKHLAAETSGQLEHSPYVGVWEIGGGKSINHAMLDGDARAVALPLLDDDPADIDWLQECGAKWSSDGTALVLKGECGPEIVFGVNRRNGEDYVGGLSLYWRHHSEKVALSYLTDDEPSRGDVRQLCRGLKIPLTEKATP